MTTVSIALCTYNGQQYLQDQLDSYSCQDRLPDELVVCDDGSTDNTIALLTEFSRTAPFPVHIYRNEEQLGVIQNFEKATWLCKGEIIFFSDQDDVWHARKIERMLAVLDNDPNIGGVFCDADVVDKTLQPLGQTVWQYRKFSTFLQRRVLAGESSAAFLAVAYVYGMSFAFRSTFRDVLSPFSKITHDVWAARMIAVLSRVTIVQETLVKYRRHSRNASGEMRMVTGAAKLASVANSITNPRTSSRRQSFMKRTELFKEVKDRLLELDSSPKVETAIRLMDAFINHTQARGVLPSTRLFRIPGILKEALSLHYYRYSGGTRQILRDLLERDSQDN